MTSIQRDGAHTYKGFEKPMYSILTYTWGRFRIKDGNGEPALPIFGTSWKIPAVKEEHFTVEKFLDVIRRMRGKDGNIDWAWIDIACIEQNNSEAQAEEIGRQASIFKKAKDVYVWLSTLQTDVLSRVVQKIQEQGLQLQDYLDGKQIPLKPYELVHSLNEQFNILFGDPWFSSLWTLQEVVMRNDALVLSAQGEPICWEPNQNMYLTILINHCQNMFKDFGKLDNKLNTLNNIQQSQETKHLITEIQNRILRVGFYYLFTDNPNVQYSTAHYRMTSRDVDRIYAIMQIYNIRVGKSIRPNENPTLDELVDEFALAINKNCLIMGQLFVHKDSSPGKTWRITSNSMVLDTLMDYKDPQQESEMSQMTMTALGGIVITGKCYPFSELYKLTQDAHKVDQSNVKLRIALDENTLRKLSQNPLHDGTFATLKSANENGMPPGWLLGHAFGGNLWVLRLGHIQGSWSGKMNRYERRYVGLLINRSAQSSEKGCLDGIYYRQGVCTWGAWYEELNTISWKSLRVELH